MKFSERIGITPVRTELQLEDMDNDLRTGLWNAFQMVFAENATDYTEDSPFHSTYTSLWHDLFKWPLDSLAASSFVSQVHESIKQWFFAASWFEVYEFTEFVVDIAPGSNRSETFKDHCIRVLEREFSGYRFVGNQLAPITNQAELTEIEEAIQAGQEHELNGVTTHLEAATAKLSDRKHPDYRNSIKESISAVESVCRAISGDQKASLGKALKAIEDKIEIHGALKRGYLAIYGYTSDENGIRHCMTEESNCDFTDAKYMLVSCSAFVNYLIMKATQAGIAF